jgi:hypothetical protein
MAKVLAAVHFPRLYVFNRDERNILGWREDVRPPHGPVFPRKVACRPAVGD